MSVTQRMLASWRRPRQVMRAMLDQGQREDRALAILIAACLLIFVAQLPGLSRAAHLNPDIEFNGRLAGALMATLFLVPLFAYLVAGISHVIARLFGGGGTFYSNRLAFFWSMLAIAPLMLLHGLVAGFIGPGPAEKIVGTLVFLGFMFQWGNALIVAEARNAMGERG